MSDRGSCYSPKIHEDLIPVLYRLARAKKIPMTRLVDEILRDGLRGQGLIDQAEGNSKPYYAVATITGKLEGNPQPLKEEEAL